MLLGGAGADYLAGGVGDDSITGGEGADYLHDGEGNDSITGGADVFVIGGGRNWVMDFDGSDRLDIGMTRDEVKQAATQSGEHHPRVSASFG